MEKYLIENCNRSWWKVEPIIWIKSFRESWMQTDSTLSNNSLIRTFLGSTECLWYEKMFKNTSGNKRKKKKCEIFVFPFSNIFWRVIACSQVSRCEILADQKSISQLFQHSMSFKTLSKNTDRFFVLCCTLIYICSFKKHLGRLKMH